MLKVALITTGCRTNQADSSAIRAALKEMPVQFVAQGTQADVVVVNACTLTADADRTAKKAINLAARQGAKPILAGCLATRLVNSNEATLDDVLIVPGTADRNQLISLLKKLALGQQPQDVEKTKPLELRTRPNIKVQDGCNHSCAYCIVPSVRGPAKSVAVDQVKAAVLEAAGLGAAEVVLTGIDLASWGQDLGGKTVFDLLDALLALNTGMRFRISSIEPHGLDEGLFQRLAGHKDMCPFLHVPVQSGSQRILDLMNRDGNVKKLAQMLRLAKQQIPGLSLGLDLICGFPGESEDDFEQTVAFVNAVQADNLHVFPFSKRPGTLAASMPDDVPNAIKAQRVAKLRTMAKHAREKAAASMIGTHVEVVDIKGRNQTSISKNGFEVVRPGPRRQGRFNVFIEGVDGSTLVAQELK
jgi:threonylcarbamoyladenosine tRNA methylthiotransferase MtaB